MRCCTVLRPWQTRTHCCGHIAAHDVSWVAQTGKHLLRTQNVSEQNQKHFLCPGHKICVRNKCCPRRQTGKHLCWQQCVLVCQGLYACVCTATSENEIPLKHKTGAGSGNYNYERKRDFVFL